MYEEIRVELLRQRDRLGGTETLRRRLVNRATGRPYSKRHVIRFLNHEVCVCEALLAESAVQALPAIRVIYARHRFAEFASALSCES